MNDFALRECRSGDVGAVLELWRQAGATPGVTDNADGLPRAVTENKANVLVALLGMQASPGPGLLGSNAFGTPVAL